MRSYWRVLLSTIIALLGILEIVSSEPLAVVPPAAVQLAGPTVGERNTDYPFTATVNPLTATLPLTYSWAATQQAPVVHTGAGTTDTVQFSWPLTRTATLTITATNAGGVVSDTHVILINPRSQLYLPWALRQHSPDLTILSFTANVTVADPGQSITLTWHSCGATSATLYHLLPSGQFGTFWSVAPTGSMGYDISSTTRNSERFMLFISNSAGDSEMATLSLPLTCPDEWFFSPAPDICPAGPPVYSAGAEEHFEQGVMLWREAEDRIYVLFADEQVGVWRVYTDEWDGEPDPNLEPPPGLYQPVRGFGLVWREQPHVRERLGWALIEEVPYESIYQSTSHWKYRHFYIKALDGGVWHLGPEGSEWEHLP
ncbi:MAG: hypothetical protein U9Q70_00445 [Chloroflexota bacterium]|nr:hypothetical protein [Chloroflexota bacterium]